LARPLHPNLPVAQSLVSARARPGEPFPCSPRELQRKRIEYEEIVSKRIPTTPGDLVARETADLKENSGSRMAKQDQSVLMGQKAQIGERIARARHTRPRGCVSVGTIVDLPIVASGKASLLGLGAWDSDPDKHVLAYKTPPPQAIMGKKVAKHVKLKIGTPTRS